MTKKFTKLRKELEYWQSELDYVLEVLEEQHQKFEEHQQKFCKENNIDLAALNNQNNEVIQEVMSSIKPKKNLSVDFKAKKQKKQMKNIYKQLAKKLHPDVGGDEHQFKEVTSAMSENNFQKIFDICEKHDILLKIDDELIELLEKQIVQIKTKVEKEKSTYSWKLFLCGQNVTCKNILIQRFLKQLFNYGGG